jgi:hypothetical protein
MISTRFGEGDNDEESTAATQIDLVMECGGKAGRGDMAIRVLPCVGYHQYDDV